MKNLIITADDLGLTRSVNEGISKAVREGVVTSVSVIPTGEAFKDAVQVIKDLSLKEIGAHLSLSETKPLFSETRFNKNHMSLFFKYHLKIISAEQIYKELRAQIESLKTIGVKITHVNSHEHIHMIPGILGIFIRLAEEYGIPAIRYPRGDRQARTTSVSQMYRSALLKYYSDGMLDALKKSKLKYTDYFFGLLDAGKIEEDSLIRLVKSVKEGSTEIVCHPGFLSPEVLDHYSWHKGAEGELFAVTSKRVAKAVTANSITLTTFGKLFG